MKFVFVSMFLVLASCGQNHRIEERSAPTAQTDILTPAGLEEFSFLYQGFHFQLREWEVFLPLVDFPQQPIDTVLQVLGPGADTHKGSEIKTYIFHDARLKFYKPAGGADFWLMEVMMLGSGWELHNGLKVNDPEESVDNLFPNASVESLGSATVYSVQGQNEPLQLRVYVENSRVSALVAWYELQ